jgi:hypothetical protein
MNKEILTEIIYQDNQGKEVIICMMKGEVNLLVGDLYNHLTHKTQFNEKIASSVEHGYYIVSKREWLHHKADLYKMMLKIIVKDLK